MAGVSSKVITVQRITASNTLESLLKSIDELPNSPASLCLTTTAGNLVFYTTPTSTISVISLSYIAEALRRDERSASALKSLLETSRMTKVLFDARKTAQLLFNKCAIKLSNPACTERAHIHEVQMMELALRQSDDSRMWLAGFDRCIAQDSNLDINTLVFEGLGRTNQFDERILHLPVLWKKYHNGLFTNRFGSGGSFWVAMIREATQKRLAVSCGETHNGYSVDSARSVWDRETIEEQTDSWNDDVEMDAITGGEFLGAEHWAKFDRL